MQIRPYRKVVVVVPEDEQDMKKIKRSLFTLIESGYQVKKRKWNGYIISDPEMKYSWEIKDVVLDVKRILKIE